MELIVVGAVLGMVFGGAIGILAAMWKIGAWLWRETCSAFE